MITPNIKRAFKGVWIPKDIWDAKDLSWTDKCLLAEIASLDDGDGCYASNQYLADRFHTSENAMAVKISELRKKGRITDRGFDGRRRKISICSAEQGLAVAQTCVESELIEGLAGAKGCHELRLTDEASPYIQEIPNQIPTEIPRSAGTMIEQAVEVYSAYPRKVGKPKAIQSIIKAIKQHSFETVMAGTLKYAEAWKDTDDLQFCPYPATWFNQERYQDDPSTFKRTDSKPAKNQGYQQTDPDVF